MVTDTASWPRRALCQLATRLASCRVSWVKHMLIASFARLYRVDMSETAVPQLASYSDFNHFFTRALAPGARPLASGPQSVALMPADGVLSQYGALRDGLMVQAKGQHYSVAELLADSERATAYRQGHYATIYLAPHNYHRVHMPLAGQLRHSRYVAGCLFSVKERSVRRVPQLLARNERLVCHFETACGPCAVVMVGALIVAGIRTVWQRGEQRPGTQDWDRITAPALERGDEMGYFCLGSTVVVLFSRGMTWHDGLSAGNVVKMGQALGEARS